MNEIKGCMNCGNISCGDNKKRRVDGCGRYISPEDKIKELEAKNAELTEMVEAYDRNRDRLIAIGFPTFKSCKEYAEKLKELETKLGNYQKGMFDECEKRDVKIVKAKKLLKDITSSYGNTEVSESQFYLKIKKAELFLKELENDIQS